MFFNVLISDKECKRAERLYRVRICQKIAEKKKYPTETAMERYLPQLLWDFSISADCAVTPGLDAGNQQYEYLLFHRDKCLHYIMKIHLQNRYNHFM